MSVCLLEGHLIQTLNNGKSFGAFTNVYGAQLIEARATSWHVFVFIIDPIGYAKCPEAYATGAGSNDRITRNG